MSSQTTRVRVGAWALLVVALVFDVLATVLSFVYTTQRDIGVLGWAVIAPILGAILVLRVGAVRMGFLMLAIGLGGSIAHVGASVPTHPSHAQWLPVVSLSSIGWLAFLGLTLAGLPLLFPTGRPPSPRWRPVLWALVAVLGLGSFLSAFSSETTLFCSQVFPGQADCATWEASGLAEEIGHCAEVRGPLGSGTECVVSVDNPIGIAWVPPLENSALGNFGYAVLLGVAIASVVSMGVRVRRAGAQERQQIKFLFASLGLLVAWALVEALAVEVLEVPLPQIPIIDFLLWTSVPVSIYLAITRFRLYDIDRLISRTVSYAIVVGLLAGIVALAAAVIGTRFSDPTVVAATTLAVAAMFNPLRRRVQGVVDRRFNRTQYDAELVMADFIASLQGRVDLDAVMEDCQRVVTDTMQPATVGVWMRP